MANELQIANEAVQNVKFMDGSQLTPSNISIPAVPNTPNPPPVATVPAGILTGQQKIDIPVPTPSPDMTAPLASQAEMTSRGLDSYIKELTPIETPEQKLYQDLLNKYTQSTVDSTGKEAFKAEQEQNFGVQRLQKDLSDLNAQLLTNNAEYQQILTNEQNALSKIEGSAVFGAEMTADQRAVARNFAILKASKASDMGLLSARAQAVQGNLQTALQLADRAVTAKYAPIEDEIKIKEAQLRSLEPILNKQEKIQALALQRKYDDEKAAIEEQKANDKAVQEMVINASAQGAPQEIIQSALNAKTPLEATKILGKYSGDYLKYEMLKEQIRTEKEQQATQRAQRGKIAADIAQTKAQIERIKTETSMLSNPSFAGGKPATQEQITNAGYATRIEQSNKILKENQDLMQKMSYAKFKALESNSAVVNALLTPQEQQVAQAMKNFITAKLRKESGASIAPSEFNEAKKIYFPNYGDDISTIMQKEATRAGVLNNLILGSGPAYSTSLQDNDFMKATGGGNQAINGTSIISGSNPDGTLNFNLK